MGAALVVVDGRPALVEIRHTLATLEALDDALDLKELRLGIICIVRTCERSFRAGAKVELELADLLIGGGFRQKLDEAAWIVIDLLERGVCATLEDMRLGDWDKFASEAGLGGPFVRRRVKELSALAGERAASIVAGLAASGLSEAALIGLANHIANRAKRLTTTV